MNKLDGLDRTLTLQVAINTGVDFDTLWGSNEYRKEYTSVILSNDLTFDDLEAWVIENLWDGKW